MPTQNPNLDAFKDIFLEDNFVDTPEQDAHDAAQQKLQSTMPLVPNPFMSADPLKTAQENLTNFPKVSRTKTDEKLASLSNALNSKMAELQRFRDLPGDAVESNGPSDNSGSWVERLDLNPTGFMGSAVNLGAEAVYGAARGIGHAITAIPNRVANEVHSGMSDAETAAYNRYQAGKATPADMALLNAPDNPNTINPQSKLDSFKDAAEFRRFAREVNNGLDFGSILHNENRDGFNAQLSEAEEDLSILTDSSQPLAERAKALASVLGTGGSAVANNKMAVAELVAENLPQMLGGGGFVAASNIGYAMDEYGKGVDAREKKGGLPLAEERDQMLLQAGSLAAAEQAGEMLQIAGAGRLLNGVNKATGKGIAAIAKAGVGSAIGEGLTEGYQTYMEGEIADKPSTALDIYQAMVAGAASGGVIAGGLRTVGEITGSTPEQAEKRQKAAEEAMTFAEAATKNDPSVYLDPESKDFNRSKAAGVMLQHAMGNDSTPETRVENYLKVSELQSELIQELKAKQELAKEDSKEGKAARSELKTIVNHLNDVGEVWSRLQSKVEQDQIGDVATAVETANTKVENLEPSAVEEVEKATQGVINLSMASTRNLTAEQADELAANKENNLSTGQRTFLRMFSAARRAFNEAQTIASVNRTVMQGDENNLGITQYRARIGAALTTGDLTVAKENLGMLESFAKSHAEKLAVMKAGYEKHGADFQVYKTANGWGYAKQGTYNKEANRKGGGFNTVKPALLRAVEAEAKALSLTRAEMAAAVALKTAPAAKKKAAPAQKSVAAKPVTPVQSKPSAPHTTSESPASLFREKREGEGRVEEDKSSSPQNPTISPPVVEETNTPGAATAPVVSSPTPDETVARSPEPSPAAPVAGAPGLQAGSAALAEAANQFANTPPKMVLSTNENVDANESANSQQEAAEQPADAPASAPAAEAATAAEKTPEHAVAALAEKAGAVAYTKRKLGDLFDLASTVLATTKDFFSTIKDASTSDYTLEEGAALKAFVKYGKQWAGVIEGNLVSRDKPDYNYEDMMQYFVTPEGTIEENVKTALVASAFTYIAENFGGKAKNDWAKINALLGRDEESYVAPEEREYFADVVAGLPTMIDALGQRAVQALGVRAKPTTPVSEMEKLKQALGSHAIRILTDGDTPFMNLKSANAAKLNEMRANGKTVKNSADFGKFDTDAVFLEIVRDADRNPTQDAQHIVDASAGSGSIINKIFGVAFADNPPTFEAPKTRKYIGGTKQLVPSILNDILAKLNKQENRVRMDKMAVWDRLGDERFAAMMGVKPVGPGVHGANRDSLDATNEGLVREMTNFRRFLAEHLGEDTDKPFFFEHYAMSQQRVGIANNMVNPQLSKIHRFLVYRPSWKATVDMTDLNALENFWLRAAEGLDIDPAKLTRDQALAKFKAKYESKDIQAALDVLTKIKYGESTTEAENDAVVAGVKASGAKAHGLDALVALAEYKEALAKKKTSFEVNMLTEVDGVTNGPMLSHLLMGAFASLEDMEDMLRMGGFYQSEGQQFNEWRATPGNEDLYQTTTRSFLATLDTMLAEGQFEDNAATLASIQEIMGELESGGNITSAGRNMIKKPLTAIMYGSGLDTAIEGMAVEFIEKIYTRIEKSFDIRDSVEGRKLHQDNLRLLKSFGFNVNMEAGIDELMQDPFTAQEERVLIDAFMGTFGKAVKETIKKDFAVLLESRRQFNAVAAVAFDMYNAAHQGIYNQFIAELQAKEVLKPGTGIASSKTGVALHDLSQEQQRELDKRLAAVTPTLQTAMSNLSEGGPSFESGMIVASETKAPQDALAYKNVSHYATGFKGAKTKSLIAYGRKTILASVGVKLGATSTHSFDAATALTAMYNEGKTRAFEVLNLHDAAGVGPHQLVEAGRRLNKALWDRSLEYSPAREMYDTYMRQIRGMGALLADKNTPQEVITQLAKSLVEQSNATRRRDPETKKWTQVPAATMLMRRAQDAFTLAYRADHMKLTGMSQMYSVAQYAVEGGNYNVTDQDRANALNRLKRLPDMMTERENALVNEVNDRLQDAIAIAVADDKEAQARAKAEKEGTAPVSTRKGNKTAFGPIGKAVVKSDLKLVKWLKQNPNASVSQVAAYLKGQNLTGFQAKLLAALMKAMGERAKQYKVNLLHADSPVDTVMELPTQPSHAWFVADGAAGEINVLGPEFADSGLTIETLLHEMTHAAIAHAIATPNASTSPLINELEELRSLAKAKLYEAKATHLLPAVESVQEFVAWAMANAEFQQLLDSIQHTTGNAENKWVSMLTKLVDTLVELLFGKKSDAASTAFKSTMMNVAGLMAASATSKASKAKINQSMAAPHPLASLKGAEIFDALEQVGVRSVPANFLPQLKRVLGMMEQSVHSPLAAMKAHALTVAAQTPVEMWDSVMKHNLAPFANSALTSGFNFTEQEAFALQQVEATVRIALTTKDGSTNAIYRELARLYNEAKAELKGKISSLHTDPVQAQAIYDFIFKMEAGTDNRSDYLSRFAALGLTNHEFAQHLGFTTEVRTQPLANLSISDRLHAIFENVLEWINHKATRTYGGQKADEKLLSLVAQLTDIEQRKRMKIAHSVGVATDTFESLFRGGADVIKNSALAVANSAMFQNSRFHAVKLAGNVIKTVANDRVGDYFDNLQKLRDDTMRERQGVLMTTVNEMRGSTAANAIFFSLNRLSKRIEGLRKDTITNTGKFVMDSFKDGGKYLTEHMKKALSYAVLRTDMAALLGPFDVAGIQKLVEDPAALAASIAQFETKLAGFTHALAYENGARALGLYLAQNRAGVENLRLNAENIAAMLGTEHKGKVDPADIEAAIPTIDVLASLYALQYVDQPHKDQLLAVFQEEASRTDGHGIEAVLKMHKDLQKQSRERLFKTSGALFMKGYTPEVYNPYIRVEVANTKTVDITTGKTAAEMLIDRGFDEGAVLKMDDADPNVNDDMRIYSLRDGGMVQYLTGIFSYTGMRKRGTGTHNGDLDLMSLGGILNRSKMARIEKGQANGVRRQGTAKVDPKLNAQGKNFLVPVFNANGDLVNYRYMMNASTKDALLERNNDFDQLIGVMAGSIFDKEQTAEQNKKAVEALKEQYDKDFAQNIGSYLQVGPNSPDKEAQEVWRLLPETTKQTVQQVWGENAMYVRYDMLDLNFGYRKMSMATPFGIPEDEREGFDKYYAEFLEKIVDLTPGLKKQQTGLYVRRVEDVWQTFVREAKDTLVVKSGMTLLGNVGSNISELIWFGVPLTDIWKHHRVALKGIVAYRKESKELDSLERALRLDHLGGKSRKDVEDRIVQLKDALAQNPVRELVEAGLMPTIVEDVAEDDDSYSYKSQLTQKVDKFVGNLNPQVLKLGKVLVMAHDTDLYKALSYGTQVSDFVARYTLYQHVINRAQNPVDAKIAVQLVSDAFVNYDVPSHRSVQYANDMGLVYFTKYYLRIQKVIALLYRDNPGRALMLLTAGHFMDFLPMLTHSALLHRVGNPFSMGAFEALTSLDDLLTIRTLMSPFRD